MLERSVERAAKEVREAADTEDNQRMQRALANHESAQADLEQALTQWEGLLDADHGPRG